MLRPIVEVLEEYGVIAQTIDELGTGLINQTYLLTADDKKYVLQCINPVFPASVNDDIAEVTSHLRGKGMTTAEIIPNYAGKLSTVYGDDSWRLMTYIDGHSFDSLDSTDKAREAGRALADFHLAASDLEMTFRHQRPHVHDTARHVQALHDALEAHTGHPQFANIQPLAADVLARVAELPVLPDTPLRLVHGDPKISNLLFDKTGAAVCWVDLDTLAHMALPLEMGDAFRSWCNPASEDAAAPDFRVDYFAAAAEGYAAVAGGWVSEPEWRSFTDGTQTILVELAARFCADALNEDYFGWDEQRFASRSEHNQARAVNQLAVLDSFLSKRAELDEALEQAFT